MKVKRKGNRKRRRQNITAAVLITLVLAAAGGGAAGYMIWDHAQSYAAAYQEETYNKALYQGSLFAQDLCVASDEVALEGFQPEESLHAAALFDVNGKSVVCGHKMFDRLYPASTTKVMTAYLALKYGNPDDEVTVSAHATDFNWDESVAGLQTGDKLTLYDLICGLMIQSGNDCGTAIAEYLCESEEAFAELMNREAAALGATGTHFMNPHGLHDENHYTTAYDLYLIFSAACKDERFMDIISAGSYSAQITGADGNVRTMIWTPTNYYSAGLATPPEGVRVLGGKTGTTDEAGNCVILYDENAQSAPYISVIMGAPDKEKLYEQMNLLFSAGM